MKASLLLMRPINITSICIQFSSHITIKVVIDKQPRDQFRKLCLHRGRFLGEKWTFSMVHFLYHDFLNPFYFHCNALLILLYLK